MLNVHRVMGGVIGLVGVGALLLGGLPPPLQAAPSRAEETARQVSESLYQNCRQGAIPFPEMLRNTEGLCTCLRDTFRETMVSPESRGVVAGGDRAAIEAHVKQQTRGVLASCVHGAMMERLFRSCLSGEGMRDIFRQKFVSTAEKQVYCLCARNETSKRIGKEELLGWLYKKKEAMFRQQAKEVARACDGGIKDGERNRP